jgi:hypothetical protein
LKADAVEAITAFADDVRAGRFPGDDETYHLSDDVLRALTGERPTGDGTVGLRGAEPRTA